MIFYIKFSFSFTEIILSTLNHSREIPFTLGLSMDTMIEQQQNNKKKKMFSIMNNTSTRDIYEYERSNQSIWPAYYRICYTKKTFGRSTLYSNTSRISSGTT